MQTVTLKQHPEILRVIRAADPTYRKTKAFIYTRESVTLHGTYWDGGSRSTYTAVELATGRNKGAPQYAPPQFGGPEGVWSPETMLAGAVANCFILSFRAIARASRLDWSALRCDVDAVLDRPERATYFTAFNVHAVLSGPEGTNIEMAERLLEKAVKICLVTASMKADTTLTTEIRVD